MSTNEEENQFFSQFGETLETKHGHGRWLGVYGGDTFIGKLCTLMKRFQFKILPEKSPDLGAAMHFLKTR